jgi:hypothetical protein
MTPMMMPLLQLYTVYQDPDDYPDEIVVRRWTVQAGRPTPEKELFLREPDLQTVREKLVNLNLVCLGREPEDDHAVLETWV